MVCQAFSIKNSYIRSKLAGRREETVDDSVLCQREKQLTAVCNLQLKALSELDCTSESSGERSVSELDQLELVQLNYLSYYLLINSLVISLLKRGSQTSFMK